jgi:CRISPR system Cascade subunit CasC
MSRFLQLHFLTSYGPANLNRDDLGRPKTAMFGNRPRLRVSSQSLKRAWRTSEVFESALKGHVGKRSKRFGRELAELMMAEGVEQKKAIEWAGGIMSQFGKLESVKKGDNEFKAAQLMTLLFLGEDEFDVLKDLARKLAAEKRAPTAQDVEALRASVRAADIAMFGRMIAEHPGSNVEAAVQVANAITVNEVEVEDDYFSAVDDLNTGGDETGSGHLGETGFGAGVFYAYLCIDRELLKENLGGDAALAQKAIAALTECAATVSPRGKQASFASRSCALYGLAEKGERQPRALSMAFLKPIDGNDLGRDAIAALEASRDGLDAVYGAHEQRYAFDALRPQGTFAEFVQFAAAD